MSAPDLYNHLASGNTTVCRAWTVIRKDGTVLGFTDHDCDLTVEGVLHRADTGMTARALQQSTGLSVDNSEVTGALSSEAINEADLAAGRYDGAEVRLRLVNWVKPADFVDLFRGSLGEVSRTGSEFRAELRGMSEALNQPVGLIYSRTCSAVLGDSRCRFDVSAPGYSVSRIVDVIDAEHRQLTFRNFAGFDGRWFTGGRLDVVTGAAAGLSGMIKADVQKGGDRVIDLWQGIRAELAPGDEVRMLAGCDKRPETCRMKFGNLLNFRGFPFIPGEDWLTAYPQPGQSQSGGRRTQSILSS